MGGGPVLRCRPSPPSRPQAPSWKLPGASGPGRPLTRWASVPLPVHWGSSSTSLLGGCKVGEKNAQSMKHSALPAVPVIVLDDIVTWALHGEPFSLGWVSGQREAGPSRGRPEAQALPARQPPSTRSQRGPGPAASGSNGHLVAPSRGRFISNSDFQPFTTIIACNPHPHSAGGQCQPLLQMETPRGSEEPQVSGWRGLAPAHPLHWVPGDAPRGAGVLSPLRGCGR